jgi:hypothetical protein
MSGMLASRDESSIPHARLLYASDEKRKCQCSHNIRTVAIMAGDSDVPCYRPDLDGSVMKVSKNGHKLWERAHRGVGHRNEKSRRDRTPAGVRPRRLTH